jgi:hypothetical protein
MFLRAERHRFIKYEVSVEVNARDIGEGKVATAY